MCWLSGRAVALMTAGKQGIFRELVFLLFFFYIMKICFPSAMRCPVCIFGLVLDWPYRNGRAKHRGRLFYFKVKNRFVLVDCLHIPLAMWAMFQSKRKPAEEMLSLGAHSCFHTIRVLPLSQSAGKNLSQLSSPSSLSLFSRMHSDFHIYHFTCLVTLSPQCKSSIKQPINILLSMQVIRSSCIRKQRWGVSFLILV